jgi:hypothetical protein
MIKMMLANFASAARIAILRGHGIAQYRETAIAIV